VGDAEVIETELVLADMEQLQKRYDRIKKEAQAKPAMRPEAEACAALLKHLEEGKSVRSFPRKEGDAILDVLKELHFLTDKPVIFCANVSDDNVTGEGNAHVAALRGYAEAQSAALVVICAQMEADLAGLSDEEAKEFLLSYGVEESSLDRTIALAYHTLGLASYLTAGEIEVRAWTFRRGWKAPRCAGVIHTDFEKGFIRAQVVSYDDYVKYGGEKGAREAGVLRPEGKDYEMKDGDVVEFLFN
jgi:GTP-binding protein YchF